MAKDVALVFVPPVNGLPGVEERHMARLAREMPALEWRECRHRDDFVRQLPEARVAMVWAFRREWLDAASRLEVLATPAAGREWIALEPDEGPRLSFGTFHGELMAETVLAFMLVFSRGLATGMALRGEGWPRREVMARQRLIRGSHAVILGFGHIGKWIGRLAAALGVRVTGVNRSDMTRPEYFAAGDRVIPMAELDGVLPEADHLILALPGDSGTDRIMDARRLGLLSPGASVYNVGRGNAIDMEALVDALRAGRIAGAGLDVFPEEPLPDDAPIRSCPNALILPHVSAFAPEYMDLFFDEFLPKLEGMLNS